MSGLQKIYSVVQFPSFCLPRKFTKSTVLRIWYLESIQAYQPNVFFLVKFVSPKHLLSSSIKPFAQSPYQSLSGPVPQCIPSKTNFVHNVYILYDLLCDMLNICVFDVQVTSPWRHLPRPQLQLCQCGRTGLLPRQSCACWSTRPSWKSKGIRTLWVQFRCCFYSIIEIRDIVMEKMIWSLSEVFFL